jgi:hypothetical protein
MARLCFVRFTFALVVFIASCRGDGRSPDRQQVQPVQPGTATVQSERESAAAGSGQAIGSAQLSAGVVTEPAVPPPGDAKLVAVKWPARSNSRRSHVA